MELYRMSVMQGETLCRTILLKQSGEVFDLTGYTAEAQIRHFPGDTELIAVMTCLVSGAEGKITLALEADQTETIPVGEYAYDLRMISADGAVTYLLGGGFVLRPSVTKEETNHVSKH